MTEPHKPAVPKSPEPPKKPEPAKAEPPKKEPAPAPAPPKVPVKQGRTEQEPAKDSDDTTVALGSKGVNQTGPVGIPRTQDSVSEPPIPIDKLEDTRKPENKKKMQGDKIVQRPPSNTGRPDEGD